MSTKMCLPGDTVRVQVYRCVCVHVFPPFACQLRAALLEAQLAEQRAASAASVAVERSAFDDRVALEAALRESEEARQRDAAAFAAKEVARDADNASRGAKEATKAASRISLLESQIEEAAEREQALERRLAKALAAFEDKAGADSASAVVAATAAVAAAAAAAAAAPVAEGASKEAEQKPVAERGALCTMLIVRQCVCLESSCFRRLRVV
jgi:hypothetical protein